MSASGSRSYCKFGERRVPRRGGNGLVPTPQSHAGRKRLVGAAVHGLAAVIFLLAAGLLGGCSPRRGHPVSVPAEANETVSPATADAVYARATNRFDRVVLFKPADGPEDDLVQRLAPLIFQEVAGASHPGALDADWFTGQTAEADGVSTPPAVFVETDTVSINHRDHLRLTWLWRYPGTWTNAGPPIVQGIRMTLDRSGAPAFWEILSDETPAQPVFASQSVETAARAQYGAPLPGCHFSLERSPPEAANTVVARVIDDGPTPMGPIVYLRAKTRSVSTLTCRCMPTQARDLVKTAVYRIVRVDQLPTELGWVFWPIGRRTGVTLGGGLGSRLEQCLRLPSSF